MITSAIGFEGVEFVAEGARVLDRLRRAVAADHRMAGKSLQLPGDHDAPDGCFSQNMVIFVTIFIFHNYEKKRVADRKSVV